MKFMVLLSCAAILAGCALTQDKIPAYLSSQYEQFGPEADLLYALLCGRAEASARGRTFGRMSLENAEFRDFIDDVCVSRVAHERYDPVVVDAMTRAGRAASSR